MSFDDHGLEGTRPLCKVCAAHPGWAHDDERARREPADTCRACLGSGVKQDVHAAAVLSGIATLVEQAHDALADESERDFRLAVARLANRAATLTHLVRNW